MEVTLIASTRLTGEHGRWMKRDSLAGDPDTLAEFAGRACYQSFDKPNEATRANEAYLANIVLQQHFSVLEHASATFYVTGVSRSLTHELIRHRHLSFSQLSQRFVDESTAEYVTPPAADGDTFALNALSDARGFAGEVYAALVEHFREVRGLTRKQAREAARAVLPNMTETRITVSGNLRAWREFIAKRAVPAADAEIREFALEVQRQLSELAPNTMQGV